MHWDRVVMVAVCLGMVGIGALGVARAVAAPRGRGPCGCELEQRRLYLDCMHEYSLGAVLSEGEPADAAELCRELAGLPSAPMSR